MAFLNGIFTSVHGIRLRLSLQRLVNQPPDTQRSFVIRKNGSLVYLSKPHFLFQDKIKVPSGTEVVTLRLKKRSNDFWLVVLEKKI